MKTITICGSMRFEKEMQQTAFSLETEYGFNVLQCVYGNKKLNESEKYNLIKAHYRKIDISDAVYIMDINGYIGDSVKEEINYAKNTCKEVIYHSEFVKNKV